MLVCRRIAWTLCRYQPIKMKIMKLRIRFTYGKFGKTEVTDLDVEVVVYEHIVALDVSMDNAKVVHVLEHGGRVDCDLHPLTQRHLCYCLFNVQHIV